MCGLASRRGGTLNRVPPWKARSLSAAANPSLSSNWPFDLTARSSLFGSSPCCAHTSEIRDKPRLNAGALPQAEILHTTPITIFCLLFDSSSLPFALAYAELRIPMLRYGSGAVEVGSPEGFTASEEQWPLYGAHVFGLSCGSKKNHTASPLNSCSAILQTVEWQQGIPDIFSPSPAGNSMASVKTGLVRLPTAKAEHVGYPDAAQDTLWLNPFRSSPGTLSFMSELSALPRNTISLRKWSKATLYASDTLQ